MQLCASECASVCLFQPKQSRTYYMEVKYDTSLHYTMTYHYINPNQAQNQNIPKKTIIRQPCPVNS